MPGSELPTAGRQVGSAWIRRFVASAHFAKLWRYGAVSVITTVLTLVLLYIFWRGLEVGGKAGVTLAGIHVSSPELANVLATGISTIPTYTLNRKWAWGKSGKSHVWREVVPFWVIAIVSLVLSTYVVGFASREAVHLSHRREVQTILGEIGNLVTYGAMWIAKYALFNRLLFQGGERTGRETGTARRSPAHLRARTSPRRALHPLAPSSAASARRGRSDRSGGADLLGGAAVESAADAG